MREQRSVLLDLDAYATPYADQWEFLRKVKRISEEALDNVLSRLHDEHIDVKDRLISTTTAASPDAVNALFTLPACARRMLREGVREYQRVACFRLAVHMKRLGLPLDLALAVLKAWSSKNRPGQCKEIITATEIESQTRYAYTHSYRGYGCEDPAVIPYCDHTCPLFQKNHNCESVNNNSK